jgi:hypothetical protein
MAKTAATAGALDVEQQREQVRALQQQLREAREALKAARPQQTPLERAETRQQASTARLERLLGKWVQQRIAAGQGRTTAVVAVLDICRHVLDSLE